MSIKLKGNNESTFAQNIKTAKQVEVTDGIKFGDGTVQITAATGGGGGDSISSGADAWGNIAQSGDIKGGFNCTAERTDIGNYQVTFITPMPNDDYSITTSSSNWNSVRVQNKTAQGVLLQTRDGNDNPNNSGCDFAVFASNAIAPEAGVGADAWVKAIYGSPIDWSASFNIREIVRTAPGLSLIHI